MKDEMSNLIQEWGIAKENENHRIIMIKYK